MKSIGNGWKRAQEAMSNAKKREGDYILRECVVNHNIQPLLDRLAAQNHAMTPEQISALHEAQWKQNANANRSTLSEKPTNWTTWQRIKRALRAL